MTKRLVLLVSLLAGALGVIGLPHALGDPIAACGSGTQGAARLGDDPAGDAIYAGNAAVPAADTQEDLRFVDATVAGDTVTFAVGVQDLTDADPPGSVGLVVRLAISTDNGAFDVEANRSYAQLDPGSATVNRKGAADGVTATFDSATDVITISAPAAVLPGRPASFSLTSAQTLADLGAILAITDEAAGSCNYTFGTPTPTAPFDRKAVTVTVIDTGIEASNPEFDYDETAAGPNGQLVGWWDFSGTTSHPSCGAASSTWCTTHGPYDPDLYSGSHGTGTTGMAAGTNAAAIKTKSACAGCNLAVAKVLNEDDDPSTAAADDSGIDGDMAAAIRWAVDVIHTDVISVSIGSAAPIPEVVLHDTYMAQRYARDNGVMVVYANGNGWGNAGVPGQPGGFMNYGNSVDVLSVGASDLDGLQATTDPEVTAAYTVMTSASKAMDDDGTPDGYHKISGTSFSAPFTAGLAAHLIASGRDCEAADLSPAFIEQLIKDTAVDSTTLAPTFEGYGEVNLGTLDVALGVLCNGATRPAVNPVTKAYVDYVSGTERRASSDTTAGEALFGSGSGGPTIVPTPAKSSSTGVIGLSTPSVADTEIFELTLLPGQSLDDTFSYLGDVSTQPDFDVYLYDVTSGVTYDSTTFLDSSARAAGEAEHLAYRNGTAALKRVRVVVVGFTIITDQAFSVTGTNLGAPVDQGLAATSVTGVI